uniref:Uncharacterized protein n=1 Tax=Rhizophora mucronata TaxID=61149 RepID=A0A2P2R326_RHIMU
MAFLHSQSIPSFLSIDVWPAGMHPQKMHMHAMGTYTYTRTWSDTTITG